MKRQRKTQQFEHEIQEPDTLLNPSNQWGSKIACGRTHGNLMPALWLILFSQRLPHTQKTCLSHMFFFQCNWDTPTIRVCYAIVLLEPDRVLTTEVTKQTETSSKKFCLILSGSLFLESIALLWGNQTA